MGKCDGNGKVIIISHVAITYSRRIKKKGKK